MNNSESINSVIARAEALDRPGTRSIALSLLETALIQNKDNIDILYQLSRIYRHDGKLSLALPILEKCHQLAPTRMRVINVLGDVYCDLKHFDKSENILKAGISVNPKDSVTVSTLAKTYSKQRKFSEAEQILIQFLRVDFFNIRMLRQLGNIYQQDNKIHLASETLEEAYRLNRKDVHSINDLAAIYARIGNVEAAFELLEQARFLEPTHSVTHITRAKIYIGQGAFDKAEMELSKSIELDKHNLKAVNLLGKVYARQGRLVEATKFLLSAYLSSPPATEEPTNLKQRRAMLIQLCNMYAQQGMHAHALELLLRSEKHDDVDTLTLDILADQHTSTGKYAEAIRLYSESLRLNYKNIDSIRKLSKVLISQSKADLTNSDSKRNDAISVLEQGRTYDRKNTDLINDLADIYMGIHDYSQAESLYLESYNLKPASSRTVYKLSNCYLYQGKFSESESLLRKRLDGDPNNTNLLNQLGKTLSQQKNYFDAVKTYEQSNTILPDNARTINGLAQAYSKLGNYSDALSILVKCHFKEINNVHIIKSLATLYIQMRQYDDAEDILKSGLVFDQRNAKLTRTLGVLYLHQENYTLFNQLMDTIKLEAAKPDLNFLSLQCRGAFLQKDIIRARELSLEILNTTHRNHITSRTLKQTAAIYIASSAHNDAYIQNLKGAFGEDQFVIIVDEARQLKSNPEQLLGHHISQAVEVDPIMPTTPRRSKDRSNYQRKKSKALHDYSYN